VIVLDEQLLSYGIQASIARWYRGTVTDITQLRRTRSSWTKLSLCYSGQYLGRHSSQSMWPISGGVCFPTIGSAWYVVLSLTHAPRKSPVSCVVSWHWSHSAPVAVGLAKWCASALSTFNTTQQTHELYTSLPGPKHRARSRGLEWRNGRCTCYANSFNSTLASWRSAVSNPSVNQP
jgi:hypothetical protein